MRLFTIESNIFFLFLECLVKYGFNIAVQFDYFNIFELSGYVNWSYEVRKSYWMELLHQ